MLKYCHNGFMRWTFVLLNLVMPFNCAADVSVESVAADIARQHNAKHITDEMTLSSTAEARGKQVVLTYILRVQKDVPKQKLAQFKKELFEEIVPKACEVNTVNIAFTKHGLYYTYIYYNRYSQKLAEITVDKHACDQLR